MSQLNKNLNSLLLKIKMESYDLEKYISEYNESVGSASRLKTPPQENLRLYDRGGVKGKTNDTGRLKLNL